MAVTIPPLQPFFPYVPHYMNWEDWTGNMVIHYGEENIMSTTEDDWKTGAQNMANMAAFAAYPVPSPEKFDNWQDWANAFSLTINGKSY